MKEKKYMAKFKSFKTYTISVLLLSSFQIYSQSKTIVPQKGIIAFVLNNEILDHASYEKSLKLYAVEMASSLKEMLLYEMLSEGKKADSTQLAEMDYILKGSIENATANMVNLEVINFSHTFSNNKIIYSTLTKSGNGNNITINTKTGQIEPSLLNYEYENIEIIDLIEDRNIKLVINKIECFKLIYKYKKEPVADFDSFTEKEVIVREMYVTDKIKCPYHPVVNHFEILQKYYPLKIEERSEMLNGLIKIYTLTDYTISE